MGRVSQETIDKLHAFIDSLPVEARSKCALCNETLTHIVKQAEAQTGAGTATVSKVLADKINETAAPMDLVTGTALMNRVRAKELGRDRNLNCHSDKIEQTDGATTENQPRTKEVSSQVGTPRRRDEQTLYLKEISKVSLEFDTAWKQMLAAINNAKAEGWISTTKAAALSHLESLTAIVEN